MKLSAVIWGFVLVCALPAFSGEKTKSFMDVKYEGTAMEPADTSLISWTAEQHEAELKEIRNRAKRSISSSDGADLESEIVKHPKYKAFRDEILAIQNAAGFDAFIKKTEADLQGIDTAYATNKSVANQEVAYQFFAAQLVPIACMRGITFRVIPLAEKSKLIQSRLVTMMLSTATNLDIYAPTKQWTAAFDYFTQPYDGIIMFNEGVDLQDHLALNCAPMLVKSIERIKRLNFSNPIVFDRKMFYGDRSFNPKDQNGAQKMVTDYPAGKTAFPDGLDRYKRLGEGEQHFSLAMKYQALSFVHFFRAYRVKDLFRAATTLGFLYGIDRGLPGISDINGVTMQEKRNALFKFPTLYTSYPDAATWTKKSLDMLSLSVDQLEAAWVHLQKQPDNETFVLNPGFFRGSVRNIGKNVAYWKAMVKGEAELSSRFTGEVVRVNLPSFYNYPPADLKKFLPYDYRDENDKDANGKQITRTDPIPAGMKIFEVVHGKPGTAPQIKQTAKRETFRNYRFGEPERWDGSVWQQILPGLTSPEDVGRRVRVISQSWGGNLIQLPLGVVAD
ncbi:MAG: hypothetical protein ABL958_13095 [Bdellovibrionia bacterium]